MKDLLLSRTTFVWFVLVGATVFSWDMGHGIPFHDARLAGSFIIAVAFIKVGVVIFEFMEIRTAPLLMQLVAVLWAVVICSVLISLFLASFHRPV